MGMWIDKARFQQSGKIRLAFRKDAKSKPSRLPANQMPHFASLDEAQSYCDRFNENEDAKVIKIRKELDYMNDYHDFSEYLDIYEKDRKEKAPNSWQNNVFYLKAYVFVFFLGVKREGNLILWSEYFEEFRDWLKLRQPFKSKRNQISLAISSMNHCFKSLNTFLETIRRKKRINIAFVKCGLYPRKMLKLKGHESVISNETFRKAFEAASELDSTCADGFYVTRHTGLRENELFGLSLADFFPGTPKDEVIQKKCALYDLKPFGYLVLESQPQSSLQVRNRNGNVLRKPLKHKDSIKPESSRIIPILDKATYNILVKRWKEQRDQYRREVFGTDKKDYLLFDGLNKNRYYNKLAKAYENAQVKYHSPHDTRHTFCTEMARLTNGDMFFCQLILGHTDKKTTERYWHIGEAIQRNLKSEAQIQDDIEFAE